MQYEDTSFLMCYIYIQDFFFNILEISRKKNAHNIVCISTHFYVSVSLRIISTKAREKIRLNF